LIYSFILLIDTFGILYQSNIASKYKP